MFLELDGAMDAATSTGLLGMAHWGDPNTHRRAVHDFIPPYQDGQVSVHQQLPREQGSLKFS
jgi:hypothetical protein